MKPTLTAEEQAALNEVLACQKESEDYLKGFRRQCDERFAHYQGYKGLDESLQKASPPDRDTIWRDAQSEWGTDLVVPFAYSTVETVLPRAISNRPTMLILPRDEDAERSVQNMRYLIAHQQQQIQYDLKLEETAKSGFIYGLGVQKQYWCTHRAKRPTLTQQPYKDSEGRIVPIWVEGPEKEETIFDDWTVEDIDIRDLFWDPFGHFLANFPGESGSCDYLIHRTWRSHRYVLDRIRKGEWGTAAAQVLDESDVKALASQQKWSEAHQQSQNVAGYSNQPQGNRLHEVWEAHLSGGERIIQVLDRQIPVAMGFNDARHKQMPFSAFRPATSGIKQLAGMGVIQPIQQLLREMSTLRSQRRDNAALKLAQVFAYSYGAIEQGDLQFFPGAAIPVHGEPRDFLYPINVGDIPNSSYQEEDRIVQDLERTSGISDTLTGAAEQTTATGHQLVQTAAGIRIARQTVRLEVELVARECAQAVALNQQMIVRQQSRLVPVPREPKPGEMGPVFDSVKVTPPELWGRFACEVEGGSMSPKNMPQQIQLAQTLDQMFRNDPDIDQRALKRRQLELVGVSHPDGYLAAEEPPLSPAILERIAAQVGEEVVQRAVEAENRENPPEGRADPQEAASQGPYGSQGGSEQEAA